MNENTPPQQPMGQPPQAPFQRFFYPPGIHWEFIGEAFNMLKANMGSWVAASLATLILSSVVGQIPGLIINTIILGSPVNTSSDVDPSKSIMATLLTLPFSFFVAGLQTCMIAGMMAMAVDQVQTGRVEMNVFSYMKNILNTCITSFVSTMAIAAGIICCVIPGIYLGGRLLMAPYYSAIEGLSVGDAISKSWSTYEKHAWSMFGLYFVSSLAAFVGFFACCIGLIFTFPVLPIVLGLTLLAFHPTIFGGMPPMGGGGEGPVSPYPRENTPPPGWPPVGPQ